MTGLKQHILVLMGLGIAIAMSALAAAPTPAIPDAVNKTFKEKFPQAKIMWVKSEVEDGVTVYAFAFTNGQTEQSTDIAADGTMLEITYVIQAKELPEAAMKSILKEAPGATLVSVERVEITHDTRHGYVYELPATVTHYEVEMTRKGSKGEVVVTPDGSVVESARWVKD